MLKPLRSFVSVKFDAVGRTHRFLLPEVDFAPPLDPGEPVVVTRGEHPCVWDRHSVGATAGRTESPVGRIDEPRSATSLDA